MKKMLLVIAGLALTLVVATAQQPTSPVSSPEKVIEALKGNAPQQIGTTRVSPDSEPSMAAILERYQRMIAAGQASPPPPTSSSLRSTTPLRPDTSSGRQRPSGEVSDGTTSSGSVPPSEPMGDTVEGIAQDLRSILARLESLARKSGGQ